MIHHKLNMWLLRTLPHHSITTYQYIFKEVTTGIHKIHRDKTMQISIYNI